jgi:ribonuclease HI
MATRLPKPQITLFFDGSTRGGNPGDGGAAALFEIDGKVGDASNVAPVSNRMGFVGNNCAEYYGLILGLRELLHAYPMVDYALTIKGDSELVIKQLKGEYQIRDEVLKDYYFVARGLLARISKTGSSINFMHIQEADALANEAAVLKISANLRFFHYPCQCSFLDGKIQGTKCTLQVKAAHDAGAFCFTPEIYVDAAVFRQCYGDDALEIIRSTGKKNLIEGKSAMTVLVLLLCNLLLVMEILKSTMRLLWTFSHGRFRFPSIILHARGTMFLAAAMVLARVAEQIGKANSLSDSNHILIGLLTYWWLV